MALAGALTPNSGITVIDLNSRIGQISNSLIVTNNDEIKNMFFNLINTPVGTRRYNPNAGSGLIALLQEPKSDILAMLIESTLKSEIAEQMNTRVSLISIAVRAVAKGYFVVVNVYDLKNKSTVSLANIIPTIGS